VAIYDDAETNVAETQRMLVAELTWAKLYTKAMHKVLGAISTTIRKGKPTTARPEMKESAEKLHDQLQSANRTVAELSGHAQGERAPSCGAVRGADIARTSAAVPR
jgi:hypothetical protein